MKMGTLKLCALFHVGFSKDIYKGKWFLQPPLDIHRVLFFSLYCVDSVC